LQWRRLQDSNRKREDQQSISATGRAGRGNQRTPIGADVDSLWRGGHGDRLNDGLPIEVDHAEGRARSIGYVEQAVIRRHRRRQRSIPYRYRSDRRIRGRAEEIDAIARLVHQIDEMARFIQHSV
jgi:hypothetical protein